LPDWGSALGSIERTAETHVSVAVESTVRETTIGVGGAELSWLLVGKASTLIGTDLRISARGGGSASDSRNGADLGDRAASLACGTFIAIWASDNCGHVGTRGVFDRNGGGLETL
jgi:hypothetical protein